LPDAAFEGCFHVFVSGLKSHFHRARCDFRLSG